MTATLDRIEKGLRSTLGVRLSAARIAGVGNMMVTPSELADICMQFNRADMTYSQIETATIPRWRGGKKNPVVNQVGNPDRIVKISRYNVNLGIWSRQIDKRVNREIGEDIPDYVPLPPNGKEYVGNSPVLVSLKDPSVFYLAVIPQGFWVETQYEEDGAILPNLHTEEYKWEGKSRVERETGLDKADIPMIRTPKITNIRYLAPWGRGEDGRFQSVELAFRVV